MLVAICIFPIRGQGSTYSSLLSCPAEQGQITHLALLFFDISPFGCLLSITHSEPLPAPLPTSSQVNLFSTFNSSAEMGSDLSFALFAERQVL